MSMSPEQISRIETILKQWHESKRAKFERNYSNLKYDSPQYAKTYREGEKYVHLLDGSSGAFMVEIATGIVYEIKGWGVPNKKKIVGEAWKPTFHGAQLEDCRYIRGSYDNRAHLWVPKEQEGAAMTPKVTVSYGRAATVNGHLTPYLYGSGYGQDVDLQKFGHEFAEYLTERYGQDVEIRGNSDGHSCGAHYDGEYPFALGAWRAHSTQVNMETGKREPNPDAGKIAFDAYFSGPLELEAEMREKFADCWVSPDAQSRRLNPSNHVTVYSTHFSTPEEAREWLKRGEWYSPVLLARSLYEELRHAAQSLHAGGCDEAILFTHCPNDACKERARVLAKARGEV